MGLNTTLLILNDYLGELEKTENIGNKLVDIIHRGYVADSLVNDYSSIPGVRVIDTTRSSHQHLLLVGGNTSVFVGSVPKWSNEPIEIIRQMADELGYKLVRK